MARSVVRAHILQAHDKRMPTLHTTLLGASGLALQGGEGASWSGIPASPRTRALGIREAASLHRLQRPPANHTRPPPCALGYLIQKQEEAVCALPSFLCHPPSSPSLISPEKKRLFKGSWDLALRKTMVKALTAATAVTAACCLLLAVVQVRVPGLERTVSTAHPRMPADERIQ